MNGNKDIGEELATLRVIGADLRHLRGWQGNSGEWADLSNNLLDCIERCEPPIRTSRVKSKPPGRVGAGGCYAERPVVAVAEVSAKFVAYGVNAEGFPDMRQMVPDMCRSVWDLPPANHQPRMDAKSRS